MCIRDRYHRKLWESYRLLGLEYGTPGDLEGEFREFLAPYLEAQNWYPLEAGEISAVRLTALTDGDGACLEAVSYTHLDVYKRQPFWGPKRW